MTHETMEKETIYRLVIYKPDNGQYTSQEIFSLDQAIYDISWSCDQNYLAFLVAGKNIVPASVGEPEDEGQKLVVLNMKHDIVAEIPDARKYVWNPISNQLAAIVGDYIEPGFRSRHMALLDVSKPSQAIIPYKALDLFWAMHDHRIYFEDSSSTIYVCDPENKSVAPTNFKGICFSPDGRYYYSSSMDEPYAFYDTASGEIIMQSHPSFKKNQKPMLMGWLESTNCLVMYHFDEKFTEILNFENSKSIQINKQFVHKEDAYVPRVLLDESNQPFEITDGMIESLK